MAKTKSVEAKSSSKETRQTFMMRAKEIGVKNFRVLNKEELKQVLAEGATQEKIDKVVAGAVARWKAGWGTRRNKNESKNRN